MTCCAVKITLAVEGVTGVVPTGYVCKEIEVLFVLHTI
jgi:hypothetical protein